MLQKFLDLGQYSDSSLYSEYSKACWGTWTKLFWHNFFTKHLVYYKTCGGTLYDSNSFFKKWDRLIYIHLIHKYICIPEYRPFIDFSSITSKCCFLKQEYVFKKFSGSLQTARFNLKRLENMTKLFLLIKALTRIFKPCVEL